MKYAIWIIRSMLVFALMGWCEQSIVWAQTQPGEEIEEFDVYTPPPVEHIEIDLEALQLTAPLIEYNETTQDVALLRSRFFTFVDDIHVVIEHAYDTEFLEEMIAFITQHPDDRAALTVKFYLAEYLAASYFARPVGRTVLQDALALYDAIYSAFPDTWEGKASGLYYALLTIQFVVENLEPDVLIAEYKRLLPLARELDQESAFFDMTPGNSVPVTAELYDAIVELELEQGNLNKAEEAFALMEQEFPAIYRTEQTRGDIDRVYAYQFHGKLTGKREGELLHYLTTSEDAKTVRQAAAAFGNLEIWFGMEGLEEGFPEKLHELTLSYVDRAMTGDAAEREEMIDLLYRLWHLAVSALLETLDADDAGRVAFAGERLLYMKNEDIITAIIDKARATEDEEKKAQLVNILARMNEPCVPVMRFRECLDDAQAQELYERLVVSALEELQGENTTP